MHRGLSSYRVTFPRARSRNDEVKSIEVSKRASREERVEQGDVAMKALQLVKRWDESAHRMEHDFLLVACFCRLLPFFALYDKLDRTMSIVQ